MRPDYTGQRYGRLTIIRKAPDWGYGKWWVRCDCGTEFVSKFSPIRIGKTISCGCAKSEHASKMCYSIKRKMIPVEATKDGETKRYESASAAARALGVVHSTIFDHLDKTPLNGYTIKRV